MISPRLSYGCMRISGTWEPKEVDPDRVAAGKAAVLAAWESGYRLFDHADIYCQGVCEEIFGQVLRDVSGMRDQVLIATKCGIRSPGDPKPHSPHRYDFSAEHIIASCEKSLKRLGVDTIDIYQLHRPDWLCDPQEVDEAFEQLASQGKVRYFGVSNFRPSLVNALAAGLSMPLVVNQVEIHLGRLDCFEDGTLDQCLEHGMTPLAWSPLRGGALSEAAVVPPQAPDREQYQNLLQTLDDIACEYDTTRSIIAIAWLLKHPSGIIPIIGSANPERIRASVQADDIDLDREHWYRLLTAARGYGLA
jgi:predicted oxidoreductase